MAFHQPHLPTREGEETHGHTEHENGLSVCEFHEFDKRILVGNGAVKIEKGQCGLLPHHSFIFLKMNSGMLRMMSMIHRQIGNT